MLHTTRGQVRVMEAEPSRGHSLTPHICHAGRMQPHFMEQIIFICYFCKPSESIKSLKQTWKQTGGGRSFIKTTAAGGTGKTPPGTGCKPGANVGQNTNQLCVNGGVSSST